MNNDRGRWARRAAAILFGASTVAVPSEARADVYIPFATSMVRAAIQLFLIVVILEAFVVWRALSTSVGKALVTALVANAATTLLGVILAFCVDSQWVRAHDFLWVAAFFVVSVVVEAEVVRRGLAVSWRRAWRAAVVMNVLSYAVLVPAGDHLHSRAEEAKRRARDYAFQQDFVHDAPSSEPPSPRSYAPDRDSAL